jgi:uncharacterized protein YceK
MKKFIVLLALLTLGGCASLQGVQSPAQAVFAAKQSYTVALTAAVAYKRLPPCAAVPVAASASPAAPALLCSDPAKVKQLQAADTAADVLLDAAEATVRSGGGNMALAIRAANEAVAAFTTVAQMLSK